jgi:regulator of replication initiation timing
MSQTTKKTSESEGLSIWSKWLDDRSNLEIVEWLRAYVDSIDPHYLTKSKVKKEISSRMSQRFREAANDIERLRKLFGDSERLNGRLQETVDQLRERLGGIRIERDEALRERDEARRLCCRMSAQFVYLSGELCTAKFVADEKGWDCFKEETP